MQKTGFARITSIVILALTINLSTAYAGSQVTQKFTLSPGWNAIFLDVQPELMDPATVFSEIKNLESVWTWLGRNSPVEFIQNPAEGLWNKPGWGVYTTDPDKAFLNSLHVILAGYPYLIKLAGDQGTTIEISGVPTVKKIRWTSNSFNLLGFRVDRENPPSFADFFGISAAHAGQAIYYLENATGKWKFIDNPSAVKIHSGTAYWVYCEGSSDYQGPVEVQLPILDGLDFGPFLNSLTITLHNTSDKTAIVNITLLSMEIDLTYRTFNKETGLFEWPPLKDMPPISLEAGRYYNIRISARRETLQAERADSLVRISDNLGTLLLVPVTVEKEAIL